MSKSIVPKETWKSVVGYEGFYEVSDHGRVRSVDRILNSTSNVGNPCLMPRKGKAMTLGRDKNGYRQVGLRNGGRKWFRVHHLVLNAFVGEMPDDCNQVNHKDCDKANNRVDNLEWCDGKHNQAEAYKNGIHTLNLHRCPDTGQVIPKYKYTPEAISRIQEMERIHHERRVNQERRNERR